MRSDKTAVFQVRVDVRDVATIHRHYFNQGIETKAVSTLTRQVLQFVADALVKQSGANPFDTTSSAFEYLDAMGLSGPLKTKGKRNYISGMQEESLAMDGFNTSYMERKGLKTIDPNQLQKAKELLDENLKQKKEESQGAILGATPGEVKE